MSLFIGALAFPGRPALAEEAKIGILARLPAVARWRAISSCAWRLRRGAGAGRDERDARLASD